MSTYSGTLKQTSKKNQYDRSTEQGCACGTCTVFTEALDCSAQKNGITDWRVDIKSCCSGFCTPVSICVPPDEEECFLGLNDNNENPFETAAWDGVAPLLKCLYTASKMNSLNVIQSYRQKFGDTPDYNRMMEILCVQESTDCINDPFLNVPMPRCANLNANNATGNVCRSWFSVQPDNVKDIIVRNYCFRFPNNNDCKCINRFLDENYTFSKRFSPFNDGCWYTPCVTDRYLKLTNLRNPVCPVNTCQVIFDNLRNNSVSIDRVKNTLNCSFNTPDNPSVPQPPLPPILPDDGENGTFFNSNFFAIFIFFIIGFIITVIILLRRNKKS